MTDIIILNWNGWHDTLECLDSVFRLEDAAFRVVLCDNHSTDDSLERIRAWTRNRPGGPIPLVEFDRADAERGRDPGSARVVLIRTGANLGFAGGCNVGLRFALAREEAAFAWLLNNDTVVDPNALNALVTRAGSEPGCQVGSRLHFYDTPDVVQAQGGMRYRRWSGLARGIGLRRAAHRRFSTPRVESKLDYISGASWLVPVELLQEVGLMTEDYFIYHEEIDWCVRSRDRYPLRYADDSLVYHKEGCSTGSSSDTRRTSLRSDYFLFRNKLRFTRRFYPRYLVTVAGISLLQAINRARRGEWAKAGMILKLVFGRNGQPV